jgi:two-component system, sensor histidine kinase LadS
VQIVIFSTNQIYFPCCSNEVVYSSFVIHFVNLLTTLLRTFLALFCLLAPLLAAGQQLGQLFEDSRILQLSDAVQFQMLPRGNVLNPDDLASPSNSGKFATLTDKQAIPTNDGNEAWLRFSLPVTSSSQIWYMRIPRMNIERVTLFYLDDKQRWMQQVAGEEVPMNQWPLLTRNPSFELSTRTDKPRQYFVKLENRTVLTERPQLIAPDEYIDGAMRVGTLAGLMIGLFGLLTVLGLLTAHLYRNKQYAWFGCMVFMLLIAQLALLGYASLRIWPSSVYLNKIMPVILPILGVAATTWFTTQVSYARNAAPHIYKIALVVIALLIGAAAAFALMGAHFPRELLSPLVALAMLWNLGSMVWMAWRMQSWLWFVVAGFAPLTISMMARLAYIVGWIAHVELAQLFGVITGCFGMMVIYGGMILRSRESFAALERESALAHTDMATGLSLPRIVSVRLPQVLARSKRFGKPCGVVMVRWLGQSAQLAPMGTAQRGAVMAHFGTRLRRLARDIDTVARYNDDHFMYLIESPVSREALNDLGIRILTSCMRPSIQLGGVDVYNVHVTIALCENGSAVAKDVIEALRTRLNQMDASTPRRVQFVDSPLSTRPPGEGPDGVALISGEALITKINELEATHVLPTIAPRSPKADPLANMVGNTGTAKSVRSK